MEMGAIIVDSWHLGIIAVIGPTHSLSFKIVFFLMNLIC